MRRQTIYLVRLGDRLDLDRSIVAAFSTRELADHACRLLVRASVQELVIDAAKERVQSGVHRFSAMKRRRSMAVEWAQPLLDFEDEEPVSITGKDIRVTVLARDEDHAMEIAADKFREHVSAADEGSGRARST